MNLKIICQFISYHWPRYIEWNLCNVHVSSSIVKFLFLQNKFPKEIHNANIGWQQEFIIFTIEEVPCQLTSQGLCGTHFMKMLPYSWSQISVIQRFAYILICQGTFEFILPEIYVMQKLSVNVWMKPKNILNEHRHVDFAAFSTI